MKKIFPLLVLALMALVSCSENEDSVEEYVDWQAKNDAYFQQKYNLAKSSVDGRWLRLPVYTKAKPSKSTDYIVVQVLESGTDTVSPIYTDSVRVSYRGHLIKSATVTDATDTELGLTFDQTYTGRFGWQTARPTAFYCGALVDGFSTALMYMHRGDRWRVYIPYQQGYGSTVTGKVPAYSTLVFDLALYDFVPVGKKFLPLP